MSTKKKCDLVKIIQKIRTQKKVKNTHGVQYACLMRQNADAIFIDEKIALKSFVKI